MPLNTITPTGYTQVSAQGASSSALLPGAGGETTVLITNYGSMHAVVALVTPVIITNATAAVGATVIAVVSATGVLVGMGAVAAGFLSPGTTVRAINGLNITLSAPTIQALAATPVAFCAPVTIAGGVAVLAGQSLALGRGTNTYMSFLSCGGAQMPAQLNVTVGS